MTEHLDEGTLQALLDGELPPGELAAAEGHVATCAACAAGLEALEAVNRRAGLLLGLADVPAPTARAHNAFRAKRLGGGFGEARRALLRAAVLVLGLAGVAAATVPGVRHFIADAVLPAPAAPADALPDAPSEHAAAPAAEAAAPPAGFPPGVLVAPDDEGAVRVAFTDAGRGLRVHVTVTDEEQAEVTAAGRFRTGTGRIEVAGAGPGDAHVALPRGAREAVVEVKGRAYAVLEGGRLRAVAPTAEGSSDDELVFRVGP